MTQNASVIHDLFAKVEPLLGRTPDDAEVQSLLTVAGKWPVPPLGAEDFRADLEDRARGFCLLFEDASTVRHASAADKPPRTAIFTGCFFYAEGVDDYHAFAGPLPEGITWSDNAASLVSKLGPPKNEMKNPKTGILSAHRWAVKNWLLTARYAGGGASLKHVYAGIV